MSIGRINSACSVLLWHSRLCETGDSLMNCKICKSFFFGLIGLFAMLGSWGCGSTPQPTEAQKKTELVGEPGKKFDPSSVPPQYKAGFEKWQQSNHSQVSGPVTVTGPKN